MDIPHPGALIRAKELSVVPTFEDLGDWEVITVANSIGLWPTADIDSGLVSWLV